jgi:beta-phosphoglucomutase family hydrolase
MIEAIIFDFDGVIADTVRAEFEAYRQAFQKYGVSLTYAEFLESRGGTSLELIDNILKRKKVRLNAMHINRTKQEIYKQLIPGIKPYTEIIGLIKRLKNYKLAIATSGSSKNVVIMLQNFGIRDRFDAVIGGEHIKKGKPDPEVFLVTAKKLKVGPENCLVVEDSLVGLEAARKAGMECILLNEES